MASSRLAIGSVLGTVASVANSIGTVADTITTGISMLNDTATAARERQLDTIAANKADYEDRIAEELGEEIMKRRIRIEELVATSPLHAKHYNEAYDKIKAAIAARRGNTPSN
jgi:hypothetical protein